MIAAASTPDKLRACRDSGADLLLNYRDNGGVSKEAEGGSSKGRGRDWRAALKRLTGGREVDVVLDNVGGADCEVSGVTVLVTRS